ncbi:hypothetical protein FE697_009490 [Mumia zhuanghuii]|uniref:Integral membrane protein n=2 Tax=Mumia TaxID=1546255 RepID=A0ABW1QPB0_9ACTN|nr:MULTISPECIES: hypothetical protein [Mumia]KAA1423787.1 hypothetical protein FE697_009490 [Mumia zhuanghuii]
MTEPDNEVTQLRAEVAALRGQLAEQSEGGGSPPSSDAGRTGWWRTPLVAVLVLLGTLMAPLSVVATWAHDEIGDTDRYVETVGPLASEPAVQAAITDLVTETIVTRLNLEQVTEDALTALSQQSFVPPRAEPLLPALSTPLTNAVENFVHDTVARVVRSDAFADAWVAANREAHAQAVAVLTGESSGAVETSDNAVSINIAPFIEASKELLVDRGFELASRIPTVDASFVLFQSADIGKAQRWFSWLDTLARVLPILGLILLATAVMVARDRRRTVITASLAVAVSMLLLGLTLNLVRPVYLDAVPTDVLPVDAAAVIYDQLVEFVRTALRAILVVALAIAIAAFLLAPTGAGAAIRTGAAGGLASLRAKSGVRRGPVSTFVSTYRTFARVLVVALGALVYISLDHPTGGSALVIVILVVLGIVVVEFLAGPRRTDEQASDDSADVPPAAGV